MPINNPNGFGRIINSAQEDLNAREDYLNSHPDEISPEDLTNALGGIIQSTIDSFMNNQELYQDAKDTNIKEAEKSFDRQKELMKYQFELQKELRSTQMQDTIEDLKKAGINPAVYFGFGGSGNTSFGISSGSVNTASVNNPASDTLSSLVNAYASMISSIAQNKNASTAVLRSCISAVGSIFSLNKSFSSSQNISTILSESDDKYSRNKIGF